MPNPSSGTISLSQINNAGTATNSMGSLVNEVIGGNSAAAQSIAMNQYYYTFAGTQTQFIQAPNGTAGLTFGVCTAISSNGNVAVVADEPYSSAVGAAYVYTRSGSTWSLQGALPVSGLFGYAHFATAVAISADGNTICASAPYDNTNVGAVYIFTYNGSSWSQQQKIVPSGYSNTYSLFGFSLALSADGNTLAVGAPNDESAGPTVELGAAYIFTRSGSTWTQRTKLIPSGYIGNFVDFGRSISLSSDGTILAVGSPYEGPNAGSVNPGAVYIYTGSGASWAQQVRLTPPAPTVVSLIEGFGNCVNLSADGKTLAIGAPYSTDITYYVNSGVTCIYTGGPASWSLQAQLLGSGWQYRYGAYGNTGPQQGTALALSKDGNSLIIGGPNDTAVNNGNAAYGSWWLFTRSGSTWSQIGSRHLGSLTGLYGAGEQLGSWVSMSSSGNVALISAIRSAQGTVYRGAIYSYQ